MFNTTTDARPGLPPAIDRLFAQGFNPLQFPVDLDLCRERVPEGKDCAGERFAAEASKLSSRNAFRPSFTADEWRTLASFCITRRLPPDYRVALRGRSDRALRFVLEGSLWQVAADGAGAPRLLLPGTILGEDALFSDEPGELDIRTLEDTVILELPLPRQKELTARFPAIAFELLRAAGAVIAARGRTAAAREELATN
jgi:CRP-like cAMP-binding protein